MFWSLCSTCKEAVLNLCEFECPARCFSDEVKLLFQEMKAKEGSIVPSSVFMSTGVCVWVCVHSVFAFPWPANHVALGSQSQNARAAFKGTCLTKMSDSSVCFVLNEICWLHPFSAKCTDMKSRPHFSTSSPPTQTSSLSNLLYKPEAAPHCLTTWLSAFSPLCLHVLLNTQENIFSTPGSHVEGSGVSAGGVWLQQGRSRCQEMSSPNHCFSHRICDKVYSMQLGKKSAGRLSVGG